MKPWQPQAFGPENLVLNDLPQPPPAPAEAPFPASPPPTPKGAASGGGAAPPAPDTPRLKVADRVVTSYCTRWIDGPPTPKESLYTLGNTIPGALAESLVLTENALAVAPAYLTNDEAAA